MMVKTNFGRQMLLNHPKLFSFGMVSHEGPSDEAMNNTHFALYFEGKGWEEKLASPEDKYTTPPNKVIRTKVAGTNPGYGATCVALGSALAAIEHDIRHEQTHIIIWRCTVRHKQTNKTNVESNMSVDSVCDVRYPPVL